MKAAVIFQNKIIRTLILQNMKKILAVLLVFLTCALLPACGEKEEAPVAVQPDYKSEVERERKRADSEKKAKEDAQKRGELAEERADFWKTMVWVVVITGICFTLVGVAIGSSARKRAEKARANE